MIALSPLFILSIAIIFLVVLIFYIKLDTRNCMIFTVGSLICALIISITIGYQVSTHAKNITEIKKSHISTAVLGKLLDKNTSDEDPLSTEKVDETIAKDASSPVATTATDEQDPNKTTDAKKTAEIKKAEEVNKATAKINTNVNKPDTQTSNKNGDSADKANLDNGILSDDSVDDDATDSDASPDASYDDATDWKASYITQLFTCDGYGLLYVSLILIISIVVSCFGYRWFKLEQPRHGLFYVILLFTTLGGVTLVYASHLISLYIGIELLSLSFVGLIGYQYMQNHSLEAAIKYMILSSVASAFLLMGIAFYYAATGELTFSGLSYKFSTLAYPSTLLSMGACLMLVGIGFKISLVPFQLWLPDVYQGTPTAVLLMLSTIGKVAIFCAIAKLFLFAPIVNNDTLHAILVIMCFSSILWGNFLALKQKSIKRLLAYSSITQFGYLMTALIAVQYQVLALETIGVYLIGFMLANISLLGGISLESHSNEPNEHDNEVDLHGLFWRRPVLAISMAISLLSLAGVPLTSGFIGRFLLILLGVTAELWWIVTAIVIGSALGLYFYARLIIYLYIKPTEKKDQDVPEMTLRMKLSKVTVCEIFIAVSALLTLLCGIYPKWLFNLVSMAQYLTP